MGHSVIPSLLKRNINRALRGAPATMGVAEAQSYSTHAFRRAPQWSRSAPAPLSLSLSCAKDGGAEFKRL